MHDLNFILQSNYHDIPNILCFNSNINNKVILQYFTDNIKGKCLNCNINTYIIDKNFDYQAICQLLSMDSLFDESYYIELKYNHKPNGRDIEELSHIMSLINNKNKLILHTDTLTYKDVKSNFFNNKICHIPIYLIQDSDIDTIVNHIIKFNHIKINQDALELIYFYNQNNPNSIIQEIKKLSLYFDTNSPITKSNILGIIQEDNQYNIYNLSHQYLQGNLNQALLILEQLLQNVDNYTLINWILSEDVRKLIKLKQSIKDLTSIKMAIKKLGIWGEGERHISTALNKISYSDLIIILNHLSILDISIKGIIDKDIKTQFIDVIQLFCNVKSK